MRIEPSHRSEMVSQILFGEHFEIKEISGTWRKVKCFFDGYEGWIDEKQYLPLELEDFQQLNKLNLHISFDLVQVILSDDKTLIPVVLASNLPFYDKGHCRIANFNFKYEGFVRSFEQPDKNLVVENAFTYLNAPYLWGGRTPFGIDCSGFTQMVYKLSGYRLKRDAHQQAESGQTINMIEEAESGDLVFFDNEEGKIVHTGILLPGGKIIHASGKVRVDSLDHHGIFNVSQNKYTHRLRLIKRCF